MPQNVRIKASLNGWLPKTAFVMAKKSSALKISSETESTLPAMESATPQTTTQLTPEAFAFSGPAKAPLMFIGHQVGTPGPALQLLEKMISAMGSKIQDVTLVNIPNSADGNAETVRSILQKFRPSVVVTLGNLGFPRGKNIELEGAQLIPSLHPEELLKKVALKKEAWEDLKIAMKFLNWMPR